jgi:hypothetical protein
MKERKKERRKEGIKERKKERKRMLYKECIIRIGN